MPHQPMPPEQLLTLFQGRDDLYAQKASSGRFFQICASRFEQFCPRSRPDFSWQPGAKSPCQGCAFFRPAALTTQAVAEHLEGKRCLGFYPLKADETIAQLGFDFTREDCSESQNRSQAHALCQSLREAGTSYLVEDLQSDVSGCRVWIFFEAPMAVEKAGELGRRLLLDALLRFGLRDTQAFDRLIPPGLAGDRQRAGIPVELPLYGALAGAASSVLLDENGRPLTLSQALQSVTRLSLASIRSFLRRTRALEEWMRPEMPVLNPPESKHPQPAALNLFDLDEPQQETSAPLAERPVSIIDRGRLEIDWTGLPLAVCGKLFALGCYWNPAYQKKQLRHKAGARVIVHAREDQGKLVLPGALKLALLSLLEAEGCSYTIQDERVEGDPAGISFRGTLYDYQQPLVRALAGTDRGIVQAATGSGKTMIGAALCAAINRPTLILVEKQAILEGWMETLNRWLRFEPPVCVRSKRFPGSIGLLQGTTNTLTGRVDVAMKGSLAGRKDMEAIVGRYGLVIVDECHHASAAEYQKILDAVKAKHVAGLSATPKRADGLDPSMHWQLGEIVGRFSSQDQMARQEFSRSIAVRFTGFVSPDSQSADFLRLCAQAAENPARCEQIVRDVGSALKQGRKVLVLTRFVDHARRLAGMLEQPGRQVLVLAGDSEDKKAGRARLDALDLERETVLVGTVQAVGEGFDFRALDTVMIALPIKSDAVVSQAIGRIHRAFEGKKQALVVDYADVHVPLFERMYRHRLCEYRRQGYTIGAWQQEETGKSPGMIYGPADYYPVYQNDFAGTQKQIVFCAPRLDERQFASLLQVLEPALRAGRRVDVFLEQADAAQKEQLALRRIYLHIHPRIAGRCAIIDQHLVWSGGVFCEKSAGEGILRLDDASAANDLLEVRRAVERRLLAAGR